MISSQIGLPSTLWWIPHLEAAWRNQSSCKGNMFSVQNFNPLSFQFFFHQISIIIVIHSQQFTIHLSKSSIQRECLNHRESKISIANHYSKWLKKGNENGREANLNPTLIILSLIVEERWILFTGSSFTPLSSALWLSRSWLTFALFCC